MVRVFILCGNTFNISISAGEREGPRPPFHSFQPRFISFTHPLPCVRNTTTSRIPSDESIAECA